MSLAVKQITIPEQKIFNDKPFPLVLTPEQDQVWTLEAAVTWVRENRATWEADSLKYGAVLFRGFPIKTASDFDQFVGAFEFEPLKYRGGAAPRNPVVGQVFTTNESPPSARIPFHNELAQTPNWPRYVWFFCEIPPASGGQTPLSLCNVVYERALQKYPEFIAKLRNKGVKYTRIIGEQDDNGSAIGRGWQSTFQTKSREEAEEIMRSMEMTWEWLPNGDLKTVSKVLPGFSDDERVGQPQFFNQIVAAYTGWEDSRNTPETAVTFGDGTPLDREAALGIADITNEVAVDYEWQHGDVVFIDNRLVQHGRRTFTPPRRVLACLAK